MQLKKQREKMNERIVNLHHPQTSSAPDPDGLHRNDQALFFPVPRARCQSRFLRVEQNDIKISIIHLFGLANQIIIHLFGLPDQIDINKELPV
jgi:hypothetical protein